MIQHLLQRREIPSENLTLLNTLIAAHFLWIYFSLSGFADFTRFPPDFYEPFGLFRLLPRIEQAFIFHFFDYLYLVSLGLFVCGYFPRSAILIAALAAVFLFGYHQNYSYVKRAEAAIVISLGLLFFSEASRTNKAGDSRILWIFRAQIIFIFFSAALEKILNSGGSWLSGDLLSRGLAWNQVSQAEWMSNALLFDQAGWIYSNPGLCRFFAILCLALEFFSPLALFSKRAAVLIIPALFFFQIAIWQFMAINFIFYYMPLFLVWLPWERKFLDKAVSNIFAIFALKSPRT